MWQCHAVNILGEIITQWLSHFQPTLCFDLNKQKAFEEISSGPKALAGGSGQWWILWAITPRPALDGATILLWEWTEAQPDPAHDGIFKIYTEPLQKQMWSRPFLSLGVLPLSFFYLFTFSGLIKKKKLTCSFESILFCKVISSLKWKTEKK